MGLAAGGLAVATMGAIGCVVVGPAIEVALFGATSSQVFAIGAIAYDLYSILFAPFVDFELEPIEWFKSGF